jgi:hypothetical protein
MKNNENVSKSDKKTPEKQEKMIDFVKNKGFFDQKERKIREFYWQKDPISGRLVKKWV